MDERTRRRAARLKTAADVVAIMNLVRDSDRASGAEDALDRFERDSALRAALSNDIDLEDVRNALALIALPRPKILDGDEGYGRRVITARRTSGEQVTLWFHGNSRTFRIKVRDSEPAGSQRPLLLDRFREIDGLVASCHAGLCGRLYVKSDERMMFCSKTCSARERQRRHRRDTPEAMAASRAAHEAAEAAKRKRGPWVPPAEPERNDPADRAARRTQHRLRFRGK